MGVPERVCDAHRLEIQRAAELCFFHVVLLFAGWVVLWGDTPRGFQPPPEDPSQAEPDRFYGYVFQDTDFSKWIEAVAYSLLQHPDPDLERTADEAIDLVCAAQDESGYLDTYYILNGMDQAFTNLRDHHELYCLGHLVEGAVAYCWLPHRNSKALCPAGPGRIGQGPGRFPSRWLHRDGTGPSPQSHGPGSPCASQAPGRACAAIALVFFARRMLALEPKAEYADVMEQALYNTVLAGMSLDGKSFFYVNPLESVPSCGRPGCRPRERPCGRSFWRGPTRGGRSPWPGAGLRRQPAWPARCRGSRTPGGGGGEPPAIAFPSGIQAEDRDGYRYLSGVWHDGDAVVLDFPMPVRVRTADPRVREDVGKAALTRGPITYCLEQADNGRQPAWPARCRGRGGSIGYPGFPCRRRPPGR